MSGLSRLCAATAFVMGWVIFSPHNNVFASDTSTNESASFQALSFMFIATSPDGATAQSSSENAPSQQNGETNNGTFQDVEDRAVLTSKDLLDLEINASQKPEEDVRRNLYKNVHLIGRFENKTTGEVLSKVISKCETLNFETASGQLFEDQVVCGNVRYSYDATKKGINIIANGKTTSTLPLDKGVYMLNDVPFTVR